MYAHFPLPGDHSHFDKNTHMPQRHRQFPSTLLHLVKTSAYPPTLYKHRWLILLTFRCFVTTKNQNKNIHPLEFVGFLNASRNFTDPCSVNAWLARSRNFGEWFCIFVTRLSSLPYDRICRAATREKDTLQISGATFQACLHELKITLFNLFCIELYANFWGSF